MNKSDIIEYKSCREIESGLTFLTGGIIAFCCSSSTSLPSAISEINEFNIDFFLKFRNECKHKTLPACAGCIYYKYAKWDCSGKIERINLNTGGICNFKCEYCGTGDTNYVLEDYSTISLRHLENLNNRGFIANGCFFTLAIGEPALYDNIDDLIAFINKVDGRACIDSNCSIYKESFEKILYSGRGIITCSVDAGTKETFGKVKGVKCFNKVIENINKYAKAGIICSKYFIYESNFQLNEIVAYCKNMYDIGVRAFIFDFDYENGQDGHKTKDKYLKSMAFGVFIAAKLNVKFSTGSAAYHYPEFDVSLFKIIKESLKEFNSIFDRELSGYHTECQLILTDEIVGLLLTMDIIKDSKSIYIWGTGIMAERTYMTIKDIVSVAGFIDNNHNKWGEWLYSLPIYSPDILQNVSDYYIVIGSSYFEEINQQLSDLNIEKYKDFRYGIVY